MKSACGRVSFLNEARTPFLNKTVACTVPNGMPNDKIN